MESNLREAYGPDSPAVRRRQIARAAFQHVAAFWVETLFLRRQLTPGNWRQVVRVPQWQAWAALRQRRRPLLLVTGYLGNPVVAACALSWMLGPLHVLADPAARLLIETLKGGNTPLGNPRNGRSRVGGFKGGYAPIRRWPGLRVIDSARAGTELPAILEAGGRVLMLAGPRGRTPLNPPARSNRGSDRGHAVSFLGRECRQPATIARLAHRHDAEIVVFACRRLDGPAFQFELSLVNRISAASRPRTAAATTRLYLEYLEQAIRDAPGQYLWTR